MALHSRKGDHGGASKRLAVAGLVRAVELDVNYAEAWQNLGATLEDFGQLQVRTMLLLLLIIWCSCYSLSCCWRLLLALTPLPFCRRRSARTRARPRRHAAPKSQAPPATQVKGEHALS